MEKPKLKFPKPRSRLEREHNQKQIKAYRKKLRKARKKRTEQQQRFGREDVRDSNSESDQEVSTLQNVGNSSTTDNTDKVVDLSHLSVSKTYVFYSNLVFPNLIFFDVCFMVMFVS